MTSRLPLDCMLDTSPARSICSIRRAAMGTLGRGCLGDPDTRCEARVFVCHDGRQLLDAGD